MDEKHRISSGLKKAMALFVSVPLASLPVAAGATDLRVGKARIRVGDAAPDGLKARVGIRAGARANIRVGARAGIRAGARVSVTPPGREPIKGIDAIAIGETEKN